MQLDLDDGRSRSDLRAAGLQQPPHLGIGDAASGPLVLQREDGHVVEDEKPASTSFVRLTDKGRVAGAALSLAECLNKMIKHGVSLQIDKPLVEGGEPLITTFLGEERCELLWDADTRTWETPPL